MEKSWEVLKVQFFELTHISFYILYSAWNLFIEVQEIWVDFAMFSLLFAVCCNWSAMLLKRSLIMNFKMDVCCLWIWPCHDRDSIVRDRSNMRQGLHGWVRNPKCILNSRSIWKVEPVSVKEKWKPILTKWAILPVSFFASHFWSTACSKPLTTDLTLCPPCALQIPSLLAIFFWPYPGIFGSLCLLSSPITLCLDLNIVAKLKIPEHSAQQSPCLWLVAALKSSEVSCWTIFLLSPLLYDFHYGFHHGCILWLI